MAAGPQRVRGGLVQERSSGVDVASLSEHVRGEILLPHDENELRQVQAWLAHDAQNQLQQPSAPPTQAAQGGWGQQAAAPAYGSPAPATGGWGAPAPAPAAAAPQAGWGAPAPVAPSPATAAPSNWGTPAPAAPAGPAPDVHPQLAEALRKKGVPGEQLTSMAQAEQIWAVVQHQPDVTA